VIVVDTNVVAYLLIGGTHTRTVERVFEADDEWCAPVLWRSELRNVLARRIKDGGCDLADTIEAWRLATTLFDRREFRPNGEHVLRLAELSACSAYDCAFIAVARDLGVPLVTFDRQVVRRFDDVAMAARAFAATAGRRPTR
jgi:predicted nucleic acid-binding protein